MNICQLPACLAKGYVSIFIFMLQTVASAAIDIKQLELNVILLTRQMARMDNWQFQAVNRLCETIKSVTYSLFACMDTIYQKGP